MIEDHAFTDKLERRWVAGVLILVQRLAQDSLSLITLSEPLILSTLLVMHIAWDRQELMNQDKYVEDKFFTCRISYITSSFYLLIIGILLFVYSNREKQQLIPLSESRVIPIPTQKRIFKLTAPVLFCLKMICFF